MNEIRKLWESVKNILHHGPSTQPLWQSLIDKLQDHETRIAAMEAGLKDKINELLAETETLLFSNIDKAMEAEFKSLVAGYEANIAALEDRLAALEGHPALSIPPLQPETAPAPAPAVEPIIAPTETLHFPAAESANDSSTAGDKAASPSAQLEPGAAGLNLEQGLGDRHGE